MTSGINAKGRFGKQDFVYVAENDDYLCPAGDQLTYHYTNEEDGSNQWVLFFVKVSFPLEFHVRPS